MKCANCGAKLQEGHLYCEVCGYEIQIVPDFDPEIENSISETLTTLAEDFTEEEELAEPQKQQAMEARMKKRRMAIPVWAAIAGIGSALALGLLLVMINQTHSYEYQKQKAESYAGRQDYEQAIQCISKAIAMDGTEMEAKLLLADYYLAAGNSENATIVLLEMIQSNTANEEVYRKLITIYEQRQDYDAISSLLESCSITSVTETYGKYAALPPEFSHPEGSYSEVVALKLSTHTAGTIYYTLDGSVPTTSSEKYTAPFMLESGDYTVSAFFVNEYQIQSEVITKEYHISVSVPLAPEVNLYTGSYTEPMMIEVKVPEDCSVYYTMDGTTPTMDSILYAVPIAMPMGKSVFQFVTYSAEGVAGEITTRTFFLDVQTNINAADAVNSLVLGLKERGILLEVDGTLPNKAGFNIYIVSTIVDIGGIDFYLVAEYYEDTIGIRTRTGNLYGVDANTGTLFKITADDRGNYFANPL